MQIDSQLRWGPHITNIADRFASQLAAFNRISASTWGASLIKSRLIYSAVIRPTISYAAGTWYSPKGTPEHKKTVDKTLETIQNKALRTVTGAYRAVGGPVLEQEAGIPPIDLHLSKLVANSVKRSYHPETNRIIRGYCERIRRRHPTQRRLQKTTPLIAKTK